MLLDHRMADILQLSEVRSRLADGTGAVLAYVVPQTYIMQGMIADTDPPGASTQGTRRSP